MLLARGACWDCSCPRLLDQMCIRDLGLAAGAPATVGLDAAYVDIEPPAVCTRPLFL